MGCNYPARAYRTASGDVVFVLRKGMDVKEDLLIPCGQCLGCKLERSRQWAIRCMHEASMYEQNCFITLTFNEENLPDGGSLEYEPFQLFMKRLRKKFNGHRIRFYMCGEYGDTGNRPHFHACLFNHNFPDRTYLKTTTTGSKLYTSEILGHLWPFGWSTIGDVTFESAAYVARYIMKKVNGRGGESQYESIDRETGEVWYREKEFSRMSLKPGIGYRWYEKYKGEVFPEDYIIVAGKKMKPPKYYFLKMKEENRYIHEWTAESRRLRALEKRDDNTEERLAVKEKVLNAKINLFSRNLREGEKI